MTVGGAEMSIKKTEPVEPMLSKCTEEGATSDLVTATALDGVHEVRKFLLRDKPDVIGKLDPVNPPDLPHEVTVQGAAHSTSQTPATVDTRNPVDQHARTR